MATNTAYTRSWFDRINYIYQEKLDEYLDNDPVAQMFTDRTGTGGKEDTLNITGRANDGFASVTVEGGKVPESNAVEEDQMSKNFIAITDRQKFTWQSFVHDKNDYLNDSAAEMAKKIMNTFHLMLTHQIHNYATSTTVTYNDVTYDLKTPDAVALISASHTTPSGLTSLTNIGGTSALSEETLTANILIGQENMHTSSGTNINYNPDMIIVPNVAPLVKKALQITRSELVESTANNAVNIYSGGSMKVMVLNFAPLLAGGARNTTTSKWAWSTADSSMLKKILHFKWSMKPKSYPKFMDSENGDSSFLVLSELAFGASRWQGIVRNNATAAPTDSAGI